MARGIDVRIVTGRLYSGSREIAEGLGIRRPIVCVDGSHIVDPMTHATILHAGLSEAAALGVREEFAKQELVSYVLAEDAVTYDSRGEDYVRYVATWSKTLRLRGDVRRVTGIEDRDEGAGSRAAVHVPLDGCQRGRRG